MSSASSLSSITGNKRIRNSLLIAAMIVSFIGGALLQRAASDSLVAPPSSSSSLRPSVPSRVEAEIYDNPRNSTPSDSTGLETDVEESTKEGARAPVQAEPESAPSTQLPPNTLSINVNNDSGQSSPATSTQAESKGGGSNTGGAGDGDDGDDEDDKSDEEEASADTTLPLPRSIKNILVHSHPEDFQNLESLMFPRQKYERLLKNLIALNEYHKAQKTQLEGHIAKVFVDESKTTVDPTTKKPTTPVYFVRQPQLFSMYNLLLRSQERWNKRLELQRKQQARKDWEQVAKEGMKLAVSPRWQYRDATAASGTPSGSAPMFDFEQDRPGDWPPIRTICEIGMNGGHSIVLFLTAIPDVTVYSFDICAGDYCDKTMKYLDKTFPGHNVHLIVGNSTESVPAFNFPRDASRLKGSLGPKGSPGDMPPLNGAAFPFQHKCDLLFIDGGKPDPEVPFNDIINMRRLASCPANIVILDDVGFSIPSDSKVKRYLYNVKVAWQRAIGIGAIMKHHCRKCYNCELVRMTAGEQAAAKICMDECTYCYGSLQCSPHDSVDAAPSPPSAAGNQKSALTEKQTEMLYNTLAAKADKVFGLHPGDGSGDVESNKAGGASERERAAQSAAVAAKRKINAALSKPAA